MERGGTGVKGCQWVRQTETRPVEGERDQRVSVVLWKAGRHLTFSVAQCTYLVNMYFFFFFFYALFTAAVIQARIQQYYVKPIGH